MSKAGFKYSDDYTDASYLAECVRNGSIRSTAIMPKDDRAVRDLARYRMTLVEDRGRLKTILVNMTANHLSIKLNADKLLKDTTVQIEMWYGNGGTERPRSPLGAIWNGVKNNGEKGAEVVRT